MNESQKGYFMNMDLHEKTEGHITSTELNY